MRPRERQEARRRRSEVQSLQSEGLSLLPRSGLYLLSHRSSWGSGGGHAGQNLEIRVLQN